MSYTKALTVGVPYNALDAYTGTDDHSSDAIALPNRPNAILTWQTSFAVAPGAVSIRILASADGSNFIEVDNSTEVAGDLRELLPANWTHVKVRQASKTGGTAYTTVTLLIK